MLLPTILYSLSNFSGIPFYLPWYWAQSSPYKKRLINDLWTGKEVDTGHFVYLPPSFSRVFQPVHYWIGRPIIPCCEGCSVHCRMSSGIPGLYPLYACKALQLWASETSLDIAKYPQRWWGEGKINPKLKSPHLRHEKEIQSWRGSGWQGLSRNPVSRMLSCNCLFSVQPWKENEGRAPASSPSFLVARRPPCCWLLVGLTSLNLGNVPT